jgi:hypothetical protein
MLSTSLMQSEWCKSSDWHTDVYTNHFDSHKSYVRKYHRKSPNSQATFWLVIWLSQRIRRRLKVRVLWFARYTIWNLEFLNFYSTDYVLWPDQIQNYFWNYESVWHSVGLIWASDHPVTRPPTPQDNTTQKGEDNHPCLERDSNPLSQGPSDQGFRN